MADSRQLRRAQSGGQPQTPVPPAAAAGHPHPSSAAPLVRVPIDFLDYWNRIWRHRGIVAAVAIVCATLGWLSTLPQQPIFQARALLELQGFNENFLNFKDVSPTSSSSYYPEVDTMTQVKLLQTRPLIEMVAEKMRSGGNLRLEPRRGSWKSRFGLAPPEKADRDTAIAAAAGGLAVKASATTRIIEITCDSPDPEVASAFANTLAEQYIESSLESRWKSTQQTGEFLTRQMRDLKARWERSEDDLNRYARSLNLVFTGENSRDNVAEERLRQLQSELSKAQADRVARQARFEMARAGNTESLAEILESESLRALKQKLTELRRQQAELGATLTPENYRVQRVVAQASQIEREITAERAHIIERIGSDFDAARKREHLLEADYRAQSDLVARQSSQTIQYNILKREAETNRQMYESMLQKVKEANLASALRASSVRVVEPAQPPEAPYRPDRRRGALLGGAFGILLGSAIVLLRERMDRTLQEPGDPEFYLRVPELGAVPRADFAIAEPFPKRLASVVSRAGDLSRLEGAVAAAGSDENERARMLALGRQNTFVTEAFRGIVTSVLFAPGQHEGRCVLAVTSASPAEGKTLTVSNLAIAFAEIHRRVLVIDADLRRPKIHRLFHLPSQYGLADLLAGDLEPDPAIVLSAVQPTAIRGLCVLASGAATGVSANLLHSARLGPIVDSLASLFDVVLIDTPPVNLLSDPRAVAVHADGAVLVVRSGRTTREAALAAKRQLEADGTSILGVVLNDWDPKKARDYGYHGYHAYYKSYGKPNSGAAEVAETVVQSEE